LIEDHLPLIAMRLAFACAVSVFGKVTVSTPFLKVLINVPVKRKTPFKTPVVAFAELTILALSFGFLFAAKRQDAVFQQDLDVVFLKAG
jgi:hypothetical protein